MLTPPTQVLQPDTESTANSICASSSPTTRPTPTAPPPSQSAAPTAGPDHPVADLPEQRIQRRPVLAASSTIMSGPMEARSGPIAGVLEPVRSSRRYLRWGYPGRSTEPGWNSAGSRPRRRVDVWPRITALRVPRAGDYGVFVAPDLGRVDPDHVIGIDVNAATMGFIPFGDVPDEEQERSGSRKGAPPAAAQVHGEGKRLLPDPVDPAADALLRLADWSASSSPGSWRRSRSGPTGHQLPEDAIARDDILTDVSIYRSPAPRGPANLYCEAPLRRLAHAITVTHRASSLPCAASSSTEC